MIDNIQQHILDNIEALSEIPQDTLENIETVTAVLSLSIPANKIIIAASSLCAPIGNIFSEEINLHNAFNEEPSLNAYNLSSNAHKINYLYTNLGVSDAIKLEFEGIAKEGDCLLILSHNTEESINFVDVIQSAKGREIPVVVFSKENDEQLKSLLDEEDTMIVLSSNSDETFIEILLTSIHCIVSVLNEDFTDEEEAEE